MKYVHVNGPATYNQKRIEGSSVPSYSIYKSAKQRYKTGSDSRRKKSLSSYKRNKFNTLVLMMRGFVRHFKIIQ